MRADRNAAPKKCDQNQNRSTAKVHEQVRAFFKPVYPDELPLTSASMVRIPDPTKK